MRRVMMLNGQVDEYVFCKECFSNQTDDDDDDDDGDDDEGDPEFRDMILREIRRLEQLEGVRAGQVAAQARV